MSATRRALPKFCGWNQNRRTGKWRVRFRRCRFSCYLPMPDAPDFAAAYAAAVAGANPEAQAREIGADKTIAGSLGAIIKAYLDGRGTSPFKGLAAETQRTRRHILENFAAAHGDKPLYRVDSRTGERIMLLKREHMQRFVNEKSATPFAQRNFLNTVRVCLEWAVGEGRIPENPALGVKREKIKTTGYRTWSEAEIGRFEAKHAIGSKARLAFALLLYTGQRRSDVVRLGRQHIHHDPQWQHGVLIFDQRKTEGGDEAHVEIPVHPKLAAIIATTPTVGVKSFLVTHFGKPYTAPGFGNWFRELCDAADCPDVSAHGLRKAAARRLAEMGCSASQIASILGHATLKEVERYTRAADRKRMAREAMGKLIEGGW
jgi:integrase